MPGLLTGFDADAAGVMLVDIDGSLRSASASDQRAQILEENQEVFAAGPCMEAFTTGRPAVIHDATMERRWGISPWSLSRSGSVRG